MIAIVRGNNYLNNRMKNKRISFFKLPGFRILLTAMLFILSASAKATSPISPFITTWQTDGSNMVKIPLTGSGYDFSIDWGDGTTESKSGSPGTISHTYATAGVKTVSITPKHLQVSQEYICIIFPIRSILLTVTQWGGGQWASMDRAFYGANNMDVTAIDMPNLSPVIDFSYMFATCSNLQNTNGSMDNWVFNSDPFNQSMTDVLWYS